MAQPASGQTPAAEADLAAIAARVGRLEEPLQRSSQTADANKEADDRSWIARLILWVFAGSLAGVGMIRVMEGLFSDGWSQVAVQAADLIKTSVLPVVTLVLGYYFGRSSKG